MVFFEVASGASIIIRKNFSIDYITTFFKCRPEAGLLVISTTFINYFLPKRCIFDKFFVFP